MINGQQRGRSVPQAATALDRPEPPAGYHLQVSGDFPRPRLADAVLIDSPYALDRQPRPDRTSSGPLRALASSAAGCAADALVAFVARAVLIALVAVSMPMLVQHRRRSFSPSD